MNINKIYNESCMDTLKRMPDSFIDCVITSPPYWMLRDYDCIEQWGLEPTYQEYLENLWSMMDLIWHKLKDEGTVWINLGDTYNGNKVGNDSLKGYGGGDNVVKTFHKRKQSDIPNKCLMLIPHRFAIGCIDRGWILRNDIIWAKRNGMPESVTDRFSKKHEFFFFFVKQQKYFFDLDKVKCKNKGKNPGDVSDFWDITTKPSRNRHYATYNDELIRKPILAGCPERGLIYDPFMGTGSTAEAAIRSNRKYVGSEVNKEYCETAKERLQPFISQLKLF